jgi:hypothetical protein
VLWVFATRDKKFVGNCAFSCAASWNYDSKKTALEKETADIALKNGDKRRNKQNDGAAKKIIRDGNVRARELIKSILT